MIVSGTGHRPIKLGGYSDEVFKKLVDLASESIEDLKPEKVISGMDLGWDQALAAAAIALSVPFVAAIPFLGQENMWPQSSQSKYKYFLSLAKKIIIVNPGSYAAWKMNERNEWMVDNSDTLLALWDGSPVGTGGCIEYSKSKGKKIINLWEKYNA